MRRTNLIPQLLALAVSLPAAVAGGCAADNPTTFMVLGNAFPSATCEYGSDVGGPFRFNGVLDLSIRNNYRMFPTVMSSLVVAEGEPLAMNTISLAGGHVELVGSNYELSQSLIGAMAASVGTVRDPTDCSGAVEPEGGTSTCALTLIDSGQGDALAAAFPADQDFVDIVAKVQVNGEVRGNSVTSNEFIYQITLCRGCLVLSNLGACSAIDPAMVGQVICQPGADDVGHCCSQPNGSAQCFLPMD